MKKLNIDAEIQALVAAGEATVVENNKFVDANGNPAKVRSMESTNDPLEVGDEVTIPENYQVINAKINDSFYPCIMATVKAADGSERCMRFFPNSLAKNITPIVDGKRAPKVKTTGTAAKEYAGYNTVDEALAAMKGKTFVVAKKDTYTIMDYTSKTERNTSICEYNWK